MAVVGKNGSGKSTFIKLLCRLYDVTEGCIKLNGIDIRKYDYKEYCDLFAVVFQDFAIFDFNDITYIYFQLAIKNISVERIFAILFCIRKIAFPFFLYNLPICFS